MKIDFNSNLLIFIAWMVSNTTADVFSLYVNEEVDTTKLNLVTILSNIGKQYTIYFELKPSSFPSTWPSIIHLTIGGSLNTYGDRSPGAWIKNDGKQTPLICAALNNVPGVGSCFSGKPLPTNAWSTFTFQQQFVQNTFFYLVKINDDIVYNKTNSKAVQFQNMKVYIGRTPWFPTISGFIRNLEITNVTWDSLIVEEADSCQGNQLGVLKTLSKEYLISVEVLPAYLEDGMNSVLRVTNGNNDGTYGDKIPAVWLYKNGSLQICSAINGNSNFCINTKPIKSKVWSKIEIKQVIVDGGYSYSVNLNGETSFTTSNTDVREFQNAKIYSGDPWYQAQTGYIRNLVIYNGYGVVTSKKNFCKPSLNIDFEFLLEESTFSITILFKNADEPGKSALNLSLEYYLPSFVSLTSESILNGFIKDDSSRIKYHFPGKLTLLGNFNHSIKATHNKKCSQFAYSFMVDAYVKISYQSSAGKVWSQYKEFQQEVFIKTCQIRIPKTLNSLPENLGRGVYWDTKYQHIYLCMDQDVVTTKAACYFSKNNGKLWQALDIRIGTIIGHHGLTRDLYAIHRNHKSYLMFSSSLKKWVTLSNNQFTKEVLMNIDLNNRVNLEEDDKKIFSLGSNQWMGNAKGLFFRKSNNELWIQTAKWPFLQQTTQT
ncbi:uncharacterized protein LOC105844195 isoform X4 [Hydra vulgaris]|uniref:Uncharacterized protein LOC105844195 isoform X4 n=1 Tax=Hydra vulgaris TaxID=6087 RepID=A0ABM4DAQ9_HYDVU